jgi:hypothetical protein
MNLLKKNFFELGVAFGQFSAKPVQDNYETICKTASPLELGLPDYDNLKNQLWWNFTPPAKWFIGSDDESLRNCYEIGILAYLRFLLALPPAPNTRTGQISEAEQKLRDLFEEENIALEVLDEYLTDLETDISSGINEVLRVFVRDFPKALPSDNEQIFENLGPPPSIFDNGVLEALQLTIDEASNCYNAECYMATIVLCGKIIETLLAHAYEWLTGENPVEKHLAFNRVRNRLSQNYNVLLDEAVDTQLRLIYQRRSAAVHGNTKIPTQDEALGVAILTQNVVNIIYGYFNDLADE